MWFSKSASLCMIPGSLISPWWSAYCHTWRVHYLRTSFGHRPCWSLTAHSDAQWQAVQILDAPPPAIVSSSVKTWCVSIPNARLQAFAPVPKQSIMLLLTLWASAGFISFFRSYIKRCYCNCCLLWQHHRHLHDRKLLFEYSYFSWSFIYRFWMCFIVLISVRQKHYSGTICYRTEKVMHRIFLLYPIH